MPVSDRYDDDNVIKFMLHYCNLVVKTILDIKEIALDDGIVVNNTITMLLGQHTS